MHNSVNQAIQELEDYFLNLLDNNFLLTQFKVCVIESKSKREETGER
jgi:hypothetical protein